MAIIAITIDEAFAQGSTWAQISSIAKFHKQQINLKQTSAKEALQKMPEWKAKRFKSELDASIRNHKEHIDYFRGMAERMREIEKEVSAHGRG